ncbi:hypothetical protein AAVH_40346 [Aphelenchoides avenae]|nr:hypothetical protein AAVH_40346 [Aphelenchus avenae]
MDFRHLLGPYESPAASHQPQNEQPELEELRKRRRALAEKLSKNISALALECMRVESEISEIQSQEEDLLNKLLHRSLAPDPSSSVPKKVEQCAPLSFPPVDNIAMPLANWQVQQILASMSTSVPANDSAHGLHLLSEDSHAGPKIELAGEVEQLQPTGSSFTGGSRTRKRLSADDSADGTKPIKEKKLNVISFEQLREHVANIANACDESTGEFKCPVCGRAKKDKSHHPYKCPVDNCEVTSVRIDNVQRHVVSVHKLEWTKEMRTASVDLEKKAAMESLSKEHKCC